MKTRINRNIRKNMEQLGELQAERQAQREKTLGEAQLLSQLSTSHGEIFDPQQHGFAFSSAEINFLIERNRQLKLARALPASDHGTLDTMVGNHIKTDHAKT